MDAFKIFHGDTEGPDGGMRPRCEGGIADDVFDKYRIIVSLFRDGFFVGALQDAVEFATGRGFGETDQLIRPKPGPAFHCKGDLTALVVCPPVADGLRAGTDSGDGHDDRSEEMFLFPATQTDIPGDLVVEKTRLAGDGSQLFNKPRHLEDDLGFRGVQTPTQLFSHGDETSRSEAMTVLVKQGDKPAHVGAARSSREVRSEGCLGHRREEMTIRVKDGDRIAQTPDADTLDADITLIRLALGIFHGAGEKGWTFCSNKLRLLDLLAVGILSGRKIRAP